MAREDFCWEEKLKPRLVMEKLEFVQFESQDQRTLEVGSEAKQGVNCW